jgi:hypothetical protein
LTKTIVFCNIESFSHRREVGKMLKQETRPEVELTEEQAVKCRHYWKIEPALAPVSHGKCRTCGVEKDFQNYLEEAPWGEWTSPSKGGVKDIISSLDISEDEGMD